MMINNYYEVEEFLASIEHKENKEEESCSSCLEVESKQLDFFFERCFEIKG